MSFYNVVIYPSNGATQRVYRFLGWSTKSDSFCTHRNRYERTYVINTQTNFEYSRDECLPNPVLLFCFVFRNGRTQSTITPPGFPFQSVLEAMRSSVGSSNSIRLSKCHGYLGEYIYLTREVSRTIDRSTRRSVCLSVVCRDTDFVYERVLIPPHTPQQVLRSATLP